MTTPEEHDVFKERNNRHNAAVNDLLQDFFRKKDEFETSLEDVTLSDAERERLLKAMDFARYVGMASKVCEDLTATDSAQRMNDFYDGIVRRIQTNSYVADIPQQPMNDDEYREIGFGD